eukprot:gene12443-15644_t
MTSKPVRKPSLFEHFRECICGFAYSAKEEQFTRLQIQRRSTAIVVIGGIMCANSIYHFTKLEDFSLNPPASIVLDLSSPLPLALLVLSILTGRWRWVEPMAILGAIPRLISLSVLMMGDPNSVPAAVKRWALVGSSMPPWIYLSIMLSAGKFLWHARLKCGMLMALAWIAMASCIVAHSPGEISSSPLVLGSEDATVQMLQGRASWVDQAGVDESGVAQAGIDQAGVDQAGADQAGVDQAGPAQAGVDEAGTAQAGNDQAGVDQAGADQAGVDQAGAAQAGVDEAGTAQAGIDQAGVDQAGADQAGAAQAGIDQAGVDQAGADQAGVDQAGAAQAGVDEAGTAQAEIDQAGVDNAGADQAGVNQAGADQAGVDQAGADQAELEGQLSTEPELPSDGLQLPLGGCEESELVGQLMSQHQADDSKLVGQLISQQQADDSEL